MPIIFVVSFMILLVSGLHSVQRDDNYGQYILFCMESIVVLLKWLSSHLLIGNEANHEETSVRISCILAENQTERLQNTSLERQH
jgi:fumarate reductase subunit C